MKVFADIFRAKHEKKLATLQRVANIVGKDHPETWDDFVTSQVMETMSKDDDLMEKFLDAAFSDLVQELSIKPDPNYKPTKKEEAMCALADIVTTLFK